MAIDRKATKPVELNEVHGRAKHFASQPSPAGGSLKLATRSAEPNERRIQRLAESRELTAQPLKSSLPGPWLGCDEGVCWADEAVTRAIGLDRVHRVVVGRPRLEVVDANAENRR